jgi:hypothetical protein
MVRRTFCVPAPRETGSRHTDRSAEHRSATHTPGEAGTSSGSVDSFHRAETTSPSRARRCHSRPTTLPGRHARRLDARGRASGALGSAHRLARGRKEGRPHRPRHPADPPRTGGTHSVRVDQQRSPVRRRVRPIDGQFVMRDRKILAVDEGTLIAEADKVGRRIRSKVEQDSPVTVPRLPRSWGPGRHRKCLPGWCSFGKRITVTSG